MTITISEEMSKEEIDELLKQLPSSPVRLEVNKKPIDMNKYKGRIFFPGSITEIQRRMRDDRNYSY